MQNGGGERSGAEKETRSRGGGGESRLMSEKDRGTAQKRAVEEEDTRGQSDRKWLNEENSPDQTQIRIKRLKDKSRAKIERVAEADSLMRPGDHYFQI